MFVFWPIVLNYWSLQRARMLILLPIWTFISMFFLGLTMAGEVDLEGVAQLIWLAMEKLMSNLNLDLESTDLQWTRMSLYILY